mmetsp:Transcript_4122/g.12874  ORF Transcript_4122/g.12874 Transcript_4122/m.12874 type:complete len:257 (+) Transcript_4122:170-940(+)
MPATADLSIRLTEEPQRMLPERLIGWSRLRGKGIAGAVTPRALALRRQRGRHARQPPGGLVHFATQAELDGLRAVGGVTERHLPPLEGYTRVPFAARRIPAHARHVAPGLGKRVRLPLQLRWRHPRPHRICSRARRGLPRGRRIDTAAITIIAVVVVAQSRSGSRARRTGLGLGQRLAGAGIISLRRRRVGCPDARSRRRVMPRRYCSVGTQPPEDCLHAAVALSQVDRLALEAGLHLPAPRAAVPVHTRDGGALA